jgi:hypothetical protein
MTQAFPFLAAIVLFLVSPVLVAGAKRQVAAWIAESQPDRPPHPTTIPDYLAPEQIDVYVEYAADIAQIVPAITLTGVGVVLALPASISPVGAAAVMLLMVLLLVLTNHAVLAMSPHRYVRRKVLGISPVNATGIAVNAVAVLVVLATA